MSGIFGIFNRDGQPIDRAVLEQMLNSLAFRGPDGQHCWQEGAVGLGHTLFAIAPEEINETQPLIFEQHVYLVGDIRLDGRDQLRSHLHQESHQKSHQQSQQPISPNTSDTALFLKAYLTWGKHCLDNLQGDFGFILWDARTQQLWCGRDQLGVRPMYYACVGNTVVVSNTLCCVQQHPLVSRALNEGAIADFLLFGFNQNPQTTTFQDIQRLPGGHTLTVTAAQTKLERYWQLPVPELQRYPRSQDYIERFQWHLDEAVRDRTRLPTASIFLSGGLDSSAIAVSALYARPELKLNALTVMYEHLIRDPEPPYTAQVAQSLDIPVDYLKSDDFTLCPGTHLTPEPSLQLFPDADQEQYRRVAKQSRIVLYGQGGDEGLRPSKVSQLIGKMSMWELFQDLWQTRWQYQCWPHLGSGLKSRLQNTGRHQPNPWLGYPDWLNPNFETRNAVRDRWLEITQTPSLPSPHPLRPRAYQQLLQPLWQLNFEAGDMGIHRQPVIVMFPYLDLRLLNYLLSLPPYPWCMDKLLTREALRARSSLPSRIIDRLKTPLGGHPFWAKLQQGGNPWQQEDWSDAIAQYIHMDSLHSTIQHPTTHMQTAWTALRPLLLSQWLNGHKFIP